MTKFTRIARTLVLSCFFMCAYAAPSLATTAISIPNPMTLTQPTPSNVVLGFEFFSSVNIELTAIGIFDSQHDGLKSGHTIAIWDDLGNIITQQLVPAGSGVLEGDFRFTEVNPVLLIAERKYVIGVYFFGNNIDTIAVANFSADYVLNPNLTIAGGRTSQSGFGIPDVPSNEVFFGPNFQFTAVPLPGAFWLMSAALGALALHRKSQS